MSYSLSSIYGVELICVWLVVDELDSVAMVFVLFVMGLNCGVMIAFDECLTFLFDLESCHNHNSVEQIKQYQQYKITTITATTTTTQSDLEYF